jgi:hypothetical protein
MTHAEYTKMFVECTKICPNLASLWITIIIEKKRDMKFLFLLKMHMLVEQGMLFGFFKGQVTTQRWQKPIDQF